MGLKLLTKKEIEKVKSIERRNEIDEGLRIARRVDGLREVVAKEEATLEKFRSESLKAIKEEISKMSSKRDSLKSEISSLEEKRSELMLPIDEQVRLAEESRKESVKIAEELRKEKERLDAIAHSHSQENERITKRLNGLNSLSEAIEVSLRDAEAKTREANRMLLSASQLKATSETWVKDKTLELERREISIANIEKGQNERHSQQDDRERKLNALQTKINDRIRMVERRKQYDKRR